MMKVSHSAQAAVAAVLCGLATILPTGPVAGLPAPGADLSTTAQERGTGPVTVDPILRLHPRPVGGIRLPLCALCVD